MFYKIEFFESQYNRSLSEEIKKVLDKRHTYSEENFEYLFVVGGDGSFMHFVKKYAFENRKIKIVGVKASGKVSFLSSLDLDEIADIESKNFVDVELLEIETEKGR